MSDYLFDAPSVRSLPVAGEAAHYPVDRIFCVGRNYAAHAAEMGFEVDREAPFYFTKTPSALAQSGQTLPYPPGTENYHHEVEIAVAISKPVFRASTDEAGAAVFGYASSLDMTRRDLQIAAREKQRPWDLGKDVENSAVVAEIMKASEFGPIGNQRIHLDVNGETKQDATLDELIWKVEEIISHLSHYYHLRPGDLILTGTPAGVGPVVAGDKLSGGVEGLAPVKLEIGPAE